MGKIWKLDVGWDDKLPKEICAEMKNLIEKLKCYRKLIFQDKLSMNKSHMDFTYFVIVLWNSMSS